MTRILLIILGACLMFCSAASAEPETCWVPQFINCPTSFTGSHCDTLVHQFQAVNPQTGEPDPSIRYHLVHGPGQIDSMTGVWTSLDELAYWGTNPTSMEVAASQGRYVTSWWQNCKVNLYPTNRQPSLTLVGVSCGDTLDLPIYETAIIPIIVSDSDLCDSLVTIAYAPDYDISVSQATNDTQSLVLVTPYLTGSEGVAKVAVEMIDGWAIQRCWFFVRGYSRPPMTMQIDLVPEVIQGQYVDVGVTFDYHYWGAMSGFNFLINFDNSALAFASASLGPAFGPEGCAWEYFTFRFGADGNCGDACPTGLVRVVGMAETNNGPYHPNCLQPDSLPATLFNLRFLVSNDRTLECTTLPIRFFWIDCWDNTLASDNGDYLHVSKSVANYDHPDIDISDPNAGFPTYLGAQSSCDSSTAPNKPAGLRSISFINGSMQIACSTFVYPIGDIDLNGIPYEVADYELFRQFFTYGSSAFTIDINHQPAATNVNQDLRNCTLPDLVSLNRVIAGLATPPVGRPGFSSNPTNLACARDVGTLYVITRDTLGAISLIYDGNVTPELLQDGPQLSYHFDGTWTRVLVAPPAGQTPMILSGPLLSAGERNCPTTAQAATWRGDFVDVTFGDITDTPDEPGGLPTEFALHPNYPNPFNPTTTISFDLPRTENVTLDIVNLLGQRVYTRTAQYNQGTHNFTWDGTDNSGRPVASGVYYFRLSAGEFIATQKLMLLK